MKASFSKSQMNVRVSQKFSFSNILRVDFDVTDQLFSFIKKIEQFYEKISNHIKIQIYCIFFTIHYNYAR